MLQRPGKQSLLKKIREAVWPAIGWWRMIKYVRLRLMRLPDSTHKVALGLAFGSSVSFTPLVGTHFIQAALYAWICRSNILASFIGTAIGNPWTFAFLWWSGFKLGTKIFEIFGWHTTDTLPDKIDFYTMIEIIKTQPLDLFLPWMVGGYLLMFLTLPPFYYLYYGIIKAGRAARRRVIEHKAHRVAKEMTGQKK